MADDPIVEDNASQEGAEDKGEQSSPAQLSPEKITQMIQEQVNLAVESGKKEIQSVKDKARAEVEQAQYRTRLAEGTLTNVGKNLGDIDPDVRAKLENEQLRAQNTYYGQLAQQQEAEQARVLADSTFTSTLSQHLTQLGIDPNSTEIDWAGEMGADYFTRQQRVFSSIAKIQEKGKKAAETKEADMAKDIEARLRKDLGLDSHDASTPAAMTKDFKDLSSSGKIMEGVKELK